MAHSLNFFSVNLNTLVLNHQCQSFGTLVSSPSKCKKTFARNIRAVQETEGPRRLIDITRSVPDISRNYVKKSSRRTLFGGISLLGGFYVAHTLSLSLIWSFGSERRHRCGFMRSSARVCDKILL